MIVLEIAAVLGVLRLIWMAFTMLVSIVVTEGVRGGHELPDDPGLLAVGICAHDEESVIFNTVRNIIEQGSRCYVLCDSCSDETSAQVQLAGGVVLLGEYHSKGLGLLPLSARMRADGFKRLAFVDADTVIGQDFCREMSAALRVHRIVQGGLKSLNADTWVAGWMAGSTAMNQRFVEWGRTCVGFSAVIAGTGWGVQSCVLRKVPLVMTSVCEDLEYTLRLIGSGEKVTYYPWAFVLNENVRTIADLWRQMERWTRGAVQVFVIEWRVCLRHPEVLLSVLMFPVMLVDVVLLSWIVLQSAGCLVYSSVIWSVVAIAGLALRGELQKIRLGSLVGHPVMMFVLVAAEVRGMLRWQSRSWKRTPHRGIIVEGS